MSLATQQQTIDKKALTWTVGVHALLLLLFFFIRYSAPSVQQLPELGMEVNLGTSDNGSGDEQPMSTEDPAPDNASASYRAASSANSAPKEMMNTDDADAPSVAPNQNKNRTNQSNNNTTANTRHSDKEHRSNTNNTQPQRPRYVYAGGNGRGGNGAPMDAEGRSEGNTTGNGDRGVPNGTPGASDYTGSPGNGTGGISHNLSRRSIIAFPPPDADFREGGRVVIRITVNKAGNIVQKQVVSASNAELRAIALRKVDKVRFNKSDDAPEEQFGNITFVFKTRS